jgi:glucokinase
MTTIAVADVGGTHARFALAEIEGKTIVSLGEPVTLRTAEHGSFQLAWQEFGRLASWSLSLIPSSHSSVSTRRAVRRQSISGT